MSIYKHAQRLVHKRRHSPTIRWNIIGRALYVLISVMDLYINHCRGSDLDNSSDGKEFCRTFGIARSISGQLVD